MKKITFLIIVGIVVGTISVLLAFAKTNHSPNMLDFPSEDYEKYWQVIDSLDRKGLPKSALAKVKELYQVAKKDNNTPQIVKTLLYQGKYIAYLEEDGQIQAIELLTKEVESTTDAPLKAILQSSIAEIYNKYMSNNYWRIDDRSSTQEFEPSDIRTWSLEKLQRETAQLYMASLEDKTSQRIDISDFSAIVTNEKTAENDPDIYRPTLYDLLAHRALDYFRNERSYLSEPNNVFYIEDREALGSVREFTNHKFQTEDTENKKYQTLLIFQDLLAFHQNDKEPTALLDANFKRLKFVLQHSIHPDKEADYFNNLQQLSRKYAKNPMRAEVDYRIAQQLANKEYKPEKEENKWAKKEALEICEKAMKDFPDSYGANQCEQLKASILSKSMDVKVEEVQLSQEDFPIYVTYKNIDKVWYRWVKIPMDKAREYSREMNYDERFRLLLKSETVDAGEWSLQQDGDYRQHSTEFRAKALPYGTYALLVATNADFKQEEGAVSIVSTTVSDLAYHYRNNDKGQLEFFVVNRKSGKALPGVVLEYFEQDYDADTRKYVYNKINQVTTDKEGKASINTTKSRYRYYVSLTYKRDYLDSDSHYAYRSSENNTTQYKGHFFLDRKIYRPGQTIYFKALPLKFEAKDDMPQLMPDQTFKVVFKDANWQEVETLSLTTNEYGTINGTFQAPESGMLGSMRMSIIYNGETCGQERFRVEEYKRPKFEVTFDPVKKGYKLGDEITVKGKAQAFAGNNIDGAKVSYRVVREARFPYWYWWWRPAPSSPSQEIAFGETTTAADGSFEVTFEAIPDKSIDEESKPLFTYEVYADVVDMTGETRSGQARVKVGTVALDVSVDMPNITQRSTMDSFSITTKNLNGQFEAAKGNVTIHQLDAPENILIQRLWETPDFPSLSRADFKQFFPNRPYKDEDQYQNWPLGKKVLATDFNTEKSKKIALDNKNLAAGKYKLVLKTQDKYGEDIQLERYFDVIDVRDKKSAQYLPFFHYIAKRKWEPGETAEIYLNSGYKNAHFLLEVEHDGKITRREWLTPKGLKKVTIPIMEKHRGGLAYHIKMVHDNRSYAQTINLTIPWSNKDLTIEYGTFRDKLYPGQEEQWQIKVSGPKGEKVAAEMLAAMYDASLDELSANNWYLNIYPTQRAQLGLKTSRFGIENSYIKAKGWQYQSSSRPIRRYRKLNWFGFPLHSVGRRYVVLGGAIDAAAPPPPAPMSAAPVEEAEMKSMDDAADAETQGMEVDSFVSFDPETYTESEESADKEDLSNISVRTNLDETVFFFPNLATDKEGNVIIQFTMNEALTEWKFLGLAHTKDLAYATTEKRVKTQKDLMVMPNAPRFFREGDRIEYTAKVSNMTEQLMEGTAMLQLFDAITNEPIDTKMGNTKAQIPFSAKAGQSAFLSWELKIPKGGVNAVTHRVVAKSGDFSDGEESAVPVLTNRMLVTETLPLPIRGGQTKTFVLDKLQQSGSSKTIDHHQMTLEFTSNPAWYAVQALPYLMEYPYDCTEQVFNRYYANSLATTVANAHPNIKKVFEDWKDTEALASNLSKNQELKYAILEDTPWVLDAQNEAQQKKNIGLLFDLNRMAKEQKHAMDKITERQLSNGGFSWFPGGRDNWYITQYLVEGLGHLDRLGVKDIQQDEKISRMMQRAVEYCDDRIVEQYERLEKRVKKGHAKWEDDHLNRMAIHYLYARSFFPNVELRGKAQKVADYYIGQAEKYWLNKGIYAKGMIALALDRKGGHDNTTADIMKSLKEFSQNDEELGMYWKYNTGYYWYQLPIETHALMIECFDEVAKDKQAVDDLKVWLLKNKQTNNWKTTKGTAAAVYAMLMRGDNWLTADKDIDITIGGKKLDQSELDKEAGTGYFKKKYPAADVQASMAEVKVHNPNSVVAWGAMYWQYMEDLDKITTFEETPLTLKKQLFIEKNTQKGPVIEPITKHDLQPGDKLKVRIELRVDRDMEYVHMKDARAAGLEPINVLSTYKWQDGLGYYESTRDASTDFFFDHLPKGTYVFEYPLRIQHRGDFSNGITTIQCMYAPEFTSHSEGIRIDVE